MTANRPEQTLAEYLIALKSQYEQALTEAEANAVHYREQLSHVNAVLLNQLVPTNGLPPLQARIETTVPALVFAPEVDASQDRPALAPAPEITEPAEPAAVLPTKPRAQKDKIEKSAPDSERVTGKRVSLPLLPAYQGLKRLEAIAQILESQKGQEVTIDSITQSLFGDLSPAQHKIERLRLKTLMYQGVKLKLWEKAATPSSYLISGQPEKGKGRSNKKASQPSSPAPEPTAETKQPRARKTSQPRGQKSAQAKPKSAPSDKKKRISLPLLPVYKDLTKLEAIAQVLAEHRGDVLHHDTIIQSLYGDLSPQELKEERVRIKTALLGGVKNKKWKKANVPSSYFI
ncbi:hypothetical protein [Altericista sp. CCNU0014]|uniref:hypothetical protein n=1 Tax=Altericista sp. CCNU0014 TaxID=3082949 RepID=UPI00384FCF4A